MRDAESTAGDQALLGGDPLGGPDQTPAGPVAGALQKLHRLTRLKAHLVGAARRKVLQHHGQLTPAGELDEEMGGRVGGRGVG